ncbi:GlsB/YeaQ/YmgE family stress response membrane protein [Corynebacterium aquatimens]|uniref:Membrane protein YeaQ/YmgE (Transglycosylase-associated protein family) n=1 Tax=Corynebacterium aquatimens TaxID=1190508 RepID=A0A931GS90_9CORY|nr:GlsB/YeaQ/YmgE family stress response membrane protein [Corynebacterium aquatimens]MBG6122803.1 putative membrane protein YeaQ/YmgE (transglycosylase-associated protein family) [Corynebacterium aquatimens]WJY66862.1 hypothetical protein CAQUA_10880 [Corynebacterium aquatimens]
MPVLGLGFLGWIVIGGIAGWVASILMKRDAEMGIWANIVVGIIGGLIGGAVLGLFFDVESAQWFFSFLTCVLGACILLWIVNKVRG